MALTVQAAVVLVLLGACTVPSGGAVALEVTPEGDVVAHVRMCEGYVDGVTVYRPDVEGQPVVGRWAAEEPVTGSAGVALGGGDGWAAPTVPQDEHLMVYGWTDDASWSADGPYFTLAELLALAPGEVLYLAADPVSDAAASENTSGDLAAFERDACS